VPANEQQGIAEQNVQKESGPDEAVIRIPVGL